MARRWVTTVVAVALPAAVTVAALPLRSVVPSADVAAVLVGVVALAGTVGLRRAPELCALSAALAFDLLWAEPYGSLQVRDPGDRLTGLVLLAVGAVLAEVCRPRRAALHRRPRPHRLGRRHGTGHLGPVSRVADDIAHGNDPSFVVVDVARTLVEVLDLADCRFEVPPLADRALPTLVHPWELELRGTRWDPVLVGLPADGFLVPVVARGRTEGRFVCVPRTRRHPRREAIVVALTLADQAASALLLASFA